MFISESFYNLESIGNRYQARIFTKPFDLEISFIYSIELFYLVLTNTTARGFDESSVQE